MSKGQHQVFMMCIPEWSCLSGFYSRTTTNLVQLLAALLP
jgi:hypothetical protein